MTTPSPHPTEQLSSLLAPGENPGSFQQDWIPYEMTDEKLKLGRVVPATGGFVTDSRQYLVGENVVVETWPPVPPVSDEDKRSDTYLPSHMQELGDFLTRLDQRMQRIESLMSQLLEAMAEGDEQDEPRTYMDGSPV